MHLLRSVLFDTWWAIIIYLLVAYVLMHLLALGAF